MDGQRDGPWADGRASGGSQRSVKVVTRRAGQYLLLGLVSEKGVRKAGGQGRGGEGRETTSYHHPQG